jgi:hypothetical protein
MSHYGPLQGGWRSAAFRLRVAANGQLCRLLGYLRMRGCNRALSTAQAPLRQFEAPLGLAVCIVC